MSGKIRVLIADGVMMMRRLLMETIPKDPELELVYVASHGKELLEAFPDAAADIVVLDIAMPKMDGIETLTAIRERNSVIPVVMFSQLTHGGSAATVESLAAGANDYVTKPAAVGHVSGAIRHIEKELIPKIKSWGRVSRGSRPPENAAESKPKPMVSTESALGSSRSADAALPVAEPLRRAHANMSTAGPKPAVAEVIAVGVSTGGPTALTELLRSVPREFETPILIVQHMPANFTQLLAERLSHQANRVVREAHEGATVESGSVWLAPGNWHMELSLEGVEGKLRLTQGPPENSCRPAVDVLFRSAARVFGRGTLGVILTGMGKDGLAGAQAIIDAGGRVWAQDEATSTVWGMPRMVVEAGLAERVLPIGGMGVEISRLHRRSARIQNAAPNVAT